MTGSRGSETSSAKEILPAGFSVSKAAVPALATCAWWAGLFRISSPARYQSLRLASVGRVLQVLLLERPERQ